MQRLLMGITVGTLLLGGTALAAEETLADSVRKACNKELTTFCKA